MNELFNWEKMGKKWGKNGEKMGKKWGKNGEKKLAYFILGGVY